MAIIKQIKRQIFKFSPLKWQYSLDIIHCNWTSRMWKCKYNFFLTTRLPATHLIWSVNSQWIDTDDQDHASLSFLPLQRPRIPPELWRLRGEVSRYISFILLLSPCYISSLYCLGSYLVLILGFCHQFYRKEDKFYIKIIQLFEEISNNHSPWFL